MKTRGVGERAKILIDSIDLEILEFLEGCEVVIGVLDLANRLDIKHKNLKPHLEKLIRIGLIKTNEYQGSRKIGLVSPRIFYDMYGYEIETDKKFGEEFQEYKEEFKNFLKVLSKIRGLELEKQTLHNISKELKTQIPKKQEKKKKSKKKK